MPIPELDDKTFDQLVEEARKLIPGYFPEWTDHNLSDPGITFIDLFAWLTEIKLYRIDLISDRHRLKYLKLLGFRPEKAGTAKVDLSFSSSKQVALGKGSQVSTKVAGREVHFRLDEGIDITPSAFTFEKVVVDEFTGGIFDRTASNEEGDLFFAPFGEKVQKGCALYLGFKNQEPDPGPPTSLNFMCYLYEKDLIPPGSHGDEEEYAFENAKLRWDFSVSDDGKAWKEITPSDGTAGFKKSGRLFLEGLEGWKSVSKLSILGLETAYYWLRCTVMESYYEYPPRIENVILNTVPASHGLAVDCGSSGKWTGDGLPNQFFRLELYPVVEHTLVITVDGERWTEVDDFEASGPKDRHFVFDYGKGEIKFGGGLMGAVPPPGSEIRVEEFVIGGGEEGNLKAGSTWKAGTFEAGGIQIENFRPSSGGREAQPLDEAVKAFLHDLKVPYTAVTALDYEYIALNTPGLRVAKAKAIPNYSPEAQKTLTGSGAGNTVETSVLDENERSAAASKGSVTVVVIPYTPLEILATPPEPSEDFKQAVCRHLDKHRLLGTELHVIPAVYVKVTVSAVVVMKDAYLDESRVRENVISELNSYLHPVKGGSEGSGWPIGRNVYLSELYEVMETVEGVKCIVRLSLSGGKGASGDGQGNLILDSKVSSVYSGKHSVEIAGEAETCLRRG